MENADKPISQDGERTMRQRLPGRIKLSEEMLAKQVLDHIEPSLAGFIERQPFFFIATASDVGACDANFRGRDSSPAGRPLPLLKIADPKTILFPDFAGNGFYNSLGNIHLNPQIGMLFIDFTEQMRARVNGRAFVEDVGPAEAKLWPKAQAIIRVQVEQAYRNCPARIPKMKTYANSDKVVHFGKMRRPK
ncbi:MAG: pyridoxamine 5'-phosphate oxidase family protein [Marinosulfonomonas sp.]|nr:pyridoxamine 5'-phosphate oxidase family protein [Marinosulfonomonas sp.]